MDSRHNAAVQKVHSRQDIPSLTFEMPRSDYNSRRHKSFLRRVSEWCHDAMTSVRKSFGNGMEAFEDFFHGFFKTVGNTFSDVQSLFIPRRFLDDLRRRSVKRAEKRAQNVEANRFTKFTETAENVFFDIWAGIKAAFGSAYQILIPSKFIESTQKNLYYRIADAYAEFGHRFKKFSERFAPKWLQKILSQAYDSVGITFKFMSEWTSSRDYLKLAWSLPAALLVAPIAGAGVYSIIYDTNDRIRHYEVALNDAIESRDDDTITLCFEKLEQLGFQRAERAIYQEAIAASEEEGRWEYAVEQMKQIAPIDRPGYAPAHVWLAMHMSMGDIVEFDRWKTIKQHCLHADNLLKGRDRNLQALVQRLLAECDRQANNMTAALDKLERLTTVYPGLQIDLMQQHVKDGNIPRARQYAAQVDSLLAQYELASEEGETDFVMEPKHYLYWANAKVLMKHYTKAIETLDRALRKFPGDPNISKIRMDLLVTQMEARGLEADDVFPIVGMILESRPKHPAVMRLLQIELDEGNDEIIEKYVAELQDMFPAILFVAAANEEVRKGDHEAAMKLYHKACEIDPNEGNAWNNIAWIKGHIDPINLDDALAAATRAIETDASNPRFLETRGQILIKQRKWRAAIADLEAALNGTLPDTNDAHKSLAAAYEALGNVELSKAHQTLSKSGT